VVVGIQVAGEEAEVATDLANGPVKVTIWKDVQLFSGVTFELIPKRTFDLDLGRRLDMAVLQAVIDAGCSYEITKEVRVGGG
jgi:hypothetical protein